MRILYVCADRGIPLRGAKGASVHVRSITAALSANGHTVTLAVAKLGAGNQPPSVHRIEQLAAEPGSQLERLIAEERIELVIERYSLSCAATACAGRGWGVPLLLEVNAPLVHEAARYRGLSDIDSALAREREVFAAADAIQVISAPLADYVHSRVPEARVLVLANGVDAERFANAVPAVVPGVGDRVLVGFTGSMKPWHGVIDLLDAFALVVDLPQRPILLLVGAGPEQEAARRRAAEPDLVGRVLMTGVVAHDDVPSLTRALDIAVAPYAASGDFYFSPLKILEYLAAGRPVIHPRIGDLASLVGDAGLAYEPGDVVGLAARLTELIGDRQLRECLGERAALRGARRGWAQVADELVGAVGRASVV